MKRRSGETGSAAVAFTFAIFLVIFTIVTVYLFLAKPTGNEKARPREAIE